MIRAELRKVFSVRSTYVVSTIAIIIVVLLSWLLVRDLKQTEQEWTNFNPETASMSANTSPPEGAKNAQGEAQPLTPEEIAETKVYFEEYKATRQREIITNSISTVATFAVIIIILQIVHEYRWNTIMHTLTASRSRTSVFLSKTAVLLAFSLFLGLLAVLVSLLTYKISVSVYDLTLPVQNVEWGTILLRGSLFTVSFVSFAVVIAFLSRNIALAIAGFLIFPSTIEPLLGLLLKDKAIYLPFSANSQMILFNQHNPPESLDFRHALITTLIYLAILYPVTWLLFLKRDAN